jgi:hypothetical protein
VLLGWPHGMRKSCWIAGLALALTAAPYCYAQTVLEGSLLPHSFGSFTCSVVADYADVTPGRNLVEVQKEAGPVQNDVCSYGSGDVKIHVRLDKYRDPSSAYEVYTALLTPDMHPSTVGELSGVDKDRLLMLLGDFVLEVRDYHSASTADLQQLAKLVKRHADQAPLPPIRSYLPEGLSDGTQRYSLGPAGFRAALERLRRSEYAPLAPEVGFENGAEVMLAEYHKHADSGVLLLIAYPTPQLAEQHLHHLQTILPGIAREGEAQIERKGSLLSLVLGATTPAYAASLRSAVNYETQVTWNEGSHALTDPPWVIVLSRIFYATGFFLVVAIVLGVAFGGVRVLTKRFFPGRVFDRTKDLEVLQLGLSGKRVDSDFN